LTVLAFNTTPLKEFALLLFLQIKKIFGAMHKFFLDIIGYIKKGHEVGNN